MIMSGKFRIGKGVRIMILRKRELFTRNNRGRIKRNKKLK